MKRYTDQILDQVTFLCRGSDLVGVTLMTNFFDGAVQVTERIKRDLDVPVIWGGVHPTIRPQESLEYADIVCVGDGEDAVLELMDRMAAGRDWSDIPNLWIKRGDVIVRNPPRPLQSNLDIYPPPDYSLEGSPLILFEGIIQPLNTGDHQTVPRTGYSLPLPEADWISDNDRAGVPPPVHLLCQ